MSFEKQIRNLQEQAQKATSKKEKARIKKKIQHIQENGFKKQHGEEHSNANKR